MQVDLKFKNTIKQYKLYKNNIKEDIYTIYIFHLIKNVTRCVTYSLYLDMRFQSRRDMKNRLARSSLAKKQVGICNEITATMNSKFGCILYWYTRRNAYDTDTKS